MTMIPATLRHAIRGTLRSPAFAITAILTLGLGIGANTAAFSALRTLLLKPIAYPEPEQLVALFEIGGADLLDWLRRTTLFTAMTGYFPRTPMDLLRDN